MLGGQKWRDSKVKGEPQQQLFGEKYGPVIWVNSLKQWSPRLDIHWEQRGNHLTKPAIPSVTSSKIQPSSSMFSLIFFSISLWTKPWQNRDAMTISKIPYKTNTTSTTWAPPPWLELSQWCPTWRPRPERVRANCAKIRIWLLNFKGKKLEVQ